MGDEKYVAFVDVLGFKSYVCNNSFADAFDYIKKFSKTIYDNWQTKEGIEGLIVSDSVIIWSYDLKKLIDFCIELSDKLFKKDIVVRIGVGKGTFEKHYIECDFKDLSKELVVGQAYIDAYIAEESQKFIGIIFREDVKIDLEKIDRFKDKIFKGKEDKKGKDYFILPVFDYDFFVKDNANLLKFIKLANKSKWLLQYCNTLFIAAEKDKKKLKCLLEKFDFTSKKQFLKFLDFKQKKKMKDNYLVDYLSKREAYLEWNNFFNDLGKAK